jgi:uncharacterized membrane protein YsdA (DUF1294 family)
MIIIVYLMIVNIIAFIMFGVDKKRAINDQWRISEKTLLGVALAGGSVGSFAGMQFFRHKTRDLKFKTLIPVFIVAHIAALRELFM